MNDKAFLENLRKKAAYRDHLCVSISDYKRYVKILVPRRRFRTVSIAEHGFKTIELFMVRQRRLTALSIPIVVGFEYDWVLALDGDFDACRTERRL